jgi:hypothetical protein
VPPARTVPRGGNAIPSIDGRPVISRADMAARGVPASTASIWYRDRAKTGHPEKAGQVDRTSYWFEDEWNAWYEVYQHRKHDSLTQVDQDGNPDDLVDAAEAARILRYSSRDVIHANRRLGYFPEPDDYRPASQGRSTPLWKRSTVWTFADSRPGMGGGRRPGIPVKPHPYAGDPRLAQAQAELRRGNQLSAAGLAEEWGVSRRTAERIIRAARAQLEDRTL